MHACYCIHVLYHTHMVHIIHVYAYGSYNHTRMVRIIVPYAYGAYETPLVEATGVYS